MFFWNKFFVDEDCEEPDIIHVIKLCAFHSYSKSVVFDVSLGISDIYLTISLSC